MKIRILIGGILCLLIIGGYLFYDHNKVTYQAQQNIEKATINLLKTSLNFYYFNEGSYPWKILGLKESLERNGSGSYKNLEKGISMLKDFKYEIRQDNKAYRISYVDQNGEKVNIEGIYTEEFHNYND